MSILGNSSNVVIDNAKMSNAGRDVKTTTQHANSAFVSSSDQVIVMEKPNVINAGGNITYITWNFQLLEMAVAALSLAFSPFRTRVSTADSEPQRPQYAEPSSTGRGAASQNEEAMDCEMDELDIGVATFPRYGEGSARPPIRNVESVLSKAYIESMIQLGIGYPMWDPQPNRDLPLDYRRRGISIGDLGAITDDGDFDFLFSVLLRANDPVNIPADLPDDFDTPPRPKVMASRRTLYNDANNLSNLQNIKTEFDQHSKDISFLCKDSAAGAILALPHGASENDLKNKRHWITFISDNALSWYKYARDNCGRDLDRHSLYLISGHTKSQSWGLVTFNTPVTERSDVLVMGKSTSANAPPYIWKEFGGASLHRSGPMVDRELAYEVDDDDSDVENQCLFLRGFKISLSEQAWNELSDVSDIDITMKDSQSPDGRRGFSSDHKWKGKGKHESESYSSSHGNPENNVSLSNFPTRSVAFHPSNEINDLLLSLVPDARMAITHDNIWMDIAKSKIYEKKEMLAATFGSRFIASYYEDIGICTFEPVEKLIPRLKQAGSLSEDNIELHASLMYILNSWTSSGLSSVADCVELCTNVLMGQQQAETLGSMNNLVLKYNEHKKWAEAEDIQVEIVKIQARTLGNEHLDTLVSMYNLSTVYFQQAKWADSEKLLGQVLEIRARIWGNEHPDTLTTMHDLALTYYQQDKLMSAETLYSQVLEMRSKIFGKEHPDTLASMHDLAVTYYKQGKLTDAENLLIEVVEMRTGTLGKEHLDTLVSMNNLTVIYFQQGKWSDTEKLLDQVQGIRARIWGNEHPDTLTTMNDLALTYYQQGKWTDAEILHSQVLEIRTRILGKTHPDTLTSMHDLAATYYKQGKLTDAENLLIEMIEMRTIMRKEHSGTLISMSNLGQIYFEQDKWTEAENLQRQVLHMRIGIFGKEHPDTLASMRDLALTYYQQRKWTEAENLLSQMLEMRARIWGNEHPETLATMLSLARTNYQQDKRTDAETLIRQVLEMRTRTLGKDHPDTLASENILTQMYDDQVQTKDAELPNFKVPETAIQNMWNEHQGISVGKKGHNTPFAAQIYGKPNVYTDFASRNIASEFGNPAVAKIR